MNMDLLEVKACLRGLLSSSAFSYTVKSLLSDFKNMTGFDLPLFGCKNPVEFLQTLTDTVQLLGDLYNPIVALLESEKSSHIISLVERQRNKKFDSSNSYGKYMLPRLIIPASQEPASNSRSTYKDEANYSLFTQKKLQKNGEHRQRGLNTKSSFRRYNEQRKNYINCPVTARNYEKHQLPERSTEGKQQNNFQVTENQPQVNLESQKVTKNLLNEFPEFVDPLSTFSESDSKCDLREASRKDTQESEKTDNWYFEDFSDIHGCDVVENKSSHFKINSSSDSYINNGMKSKLQHLMKKYPDGLWCCELPGSFFKEFNVVLDYREFGYTSLIEMLSELPDVFRCIRPGNEDWILFDASVPHSDKEKKMIKLQENGNISSDIANNLYKLLLKYYNSTDTGIELTEIPHLYRVCGPLQIMFDTTLDFQRLGFESLKSLIQTYEGSLLNIYEVDKKYVAVPILKASAPSSVQWKEALPPITQDNDIFKEIFPNDVVGPEGSFPELDLSLHIAVGQRIEVCVAEVWSPGEFCLQLNRFKNRWNQFSTDLQNFYNMHLNKYKMPDSTIVNNQLCVGLYSEDSENPDEWNRARILKVINERIVMVEFVDFGTVARLKKTQLRFLHRSFQSLPVQAFSAELYNLVPNNGLLWSMKASKKFLELSRVPYLEAELIDIDFKKPLLKVVLYDPSYTPHLNINKKLVDDNLAKLMESKKELCEPDAEESEDPKTVTSGNVITGSTFGVVSDEFSDASDLDCDSYTAFFHFKMKSQKASDDERPSEKEEKQKTNEIINEFEEVSDWDKIDEKPETAIETENSKEPDLFDIQEHILQLIRNSKSDKVDLVKPEQNAPERIVRRLPPGLENALQLNKFQMLPYEQPEGIRKKLNILTVELLTTNPSIKQVAIQDPSLALKIASEMAEVYIRWMCYNVNPFGTNRLAGEVMSEPAFLLPVQWPCLGPGVFHPVESISLAGGLQQKKEISRTGTLNVSPPRANEQSTPSSKADGKSTKYIQMENLGGKNIHVARINGRVFFFAEELIRTFSTITNRDVADRVLHLKKIIIQYKILNKDNAEKILTEIKRFVIPGVFKKKSKKWNVYLVPSEAVNEYLRGLGCDTERFQNDILRLEKTQQDKATRVSGSS